MERLKERAQQKTTPLKEIYLIIWIPESNRQTLRLERGTLSLGEFLEIVAHMCYNPKRHCATGRAPELSRPTLTARRRGAPPPPPNKSIQILVNSLCKNGKINQKFTVCE
jgi:hypothetical protein